MSFLAFEQRLKYPGYLKKKKSLHKMVARSMRFSTAAGNKLRLSIKESKKLTL